ncbi:MAG TPA: MoxR family ATPase [Edaphocola sp.]|nr:MoxR family ATPase [Edaphocola sp.]
MSIQTSEVIAVKELQEKYQQLKDTIAQVIVGQSEVVEKLVISILCNGHSLLVGVPGLAKTLLVRTLSDVLDLRFKRIQFTPDLMPGDITGSEILDEHRQFRFIKGPVFAQIILADEINRTPPKTQAALLEAMQERNVTASGTIYKLPAPFFVLATQNPIEQEGTYPLPEAQLDRFMFQILVDYPGLEEEMTIVRQATKAQAPSLPKILHAEEILAYQQLVQQVPVADNVFSYAVNLVRRTRPSGENTFAEKYLSWGAGPRASQYLVLSAKCYALLHGKFTPDIEDVSAVAPDVLRHRIVRNYKAEAEGMGLDEIIKQIL